MGFFYYFFFFFSFFLSLFCFSPVSPRLCGGFLARLPTQTAPRCQEVPPTPVPSPTAAHPLSGSGVFSQTKKVDYYFSRAFLPFCNKRPRPRVPKQGSKGAFEFSLFFFSTSLRNPSRADGFSAVLTPRRNKSSNTLWRCRIQLLADINPTRSLQSFFSLVEDPSIKQRGCCTAEGPAQAAKPPPKKAQKVLVSSELPCLPPDYLTIGLPRKAELLPDTPRLPSSPAEQQGWFMHHLSRRAAFTSLRFCIKITAFPSSARRMSSADEYQCQSNVSYFFFSMEK